MENSHMAPAPIDEPEEMREETAQEEGAPSEEEEASLPYQCALSSLEREDYEIEPFFFKYADQELNSLQYTREPFEAEDGAILYGDFDLWDTIAPVTIATARSAENLWRPVKITGRLLSLSDAIPVGVLDNDEPQTLPARIIEFTDKEQGRFQTLPFPESLLPENLNQLLRSQQLVTFLGCALYIEKKKKQHYRFFLHRLAPTASMTDLVAPQLSQEIDPGFVVRHASESPGAPGQSLGIPVNHPYLLVERYGYSESRSRDGRALFDYIKDSLMRNLRLMGSEHGAKHLERGLEFVILQALSQGMSDGFSNKLHGLIIGPANVGKSKLTDAAKDITPIASEMGDVGAKQTAAGKIGRVREVKGVTLSVGGILPSSSGGTVCLQDFHLMEGGARRSFFAMCSLLMEKGFVRDDTSANASLEAEISLLVDTNRYHQVVRQDPPAANSYADLDIPINILSRFDFILDIPDDATRQEQISDQMGLASLAPRQEWQAELKNLIAFLRDHYGANIVISQEVNEYSRAELRALFERYESAELAKNIDDHRIRIQRSLKKYVLAIACAWACPVITEAHIDFAMKFIEEKVSFLTSQTYDDPQLDKRTVRKTARKDVLLGEFQGRTFTTQEVRAFYQEKFPELSPRNIQRDLEALKKEGKIQRVRHAHWTAALQAHSEGEGDKAEASEMPAKAKSAKPASQGSKVKKAIKKAVKATKPTKGKKKATTKAKKNKAAKGGTIRRAGRGKK